MKYTILPYDDTQAHGLNRYIVDEVSDIETLPAYIQPGSKAIVANSGDVYLLNNEHKWIKQPTSSEGGSGGDNRFLITATLTGGSGDSVWTMDKTFNEIKEAFYSGKTCVVDMTYSYEETREVYYGSVACVNLRESQYETSYGVDVIYSNNGQQGFYAATPDDYPYYSWD